MKKIIILFGLSLALLPSLARAYDHMLSIGAGISSPSFNSALGENPAGLIYNQQLLLLLDGAATNSNLSNIGAGGALFLGNGSVGAGFGIQTFNEQGDGGEQTFADIGLAAEIPSLDLSFGVTGTYTFQKTTSTVGTGSNSGSHSGSLNADLGMIYHPKGSVRLGATAFQILDHLNALGAGIAVDASSWATFVVDTTFSTQLNGATLKPAMGVHLKELQLTAGYGIALDDLPSCWMPRGASFGIGAELGHSLHLQGYYNQLALYFLGLSFRL